MPELPEVETVKRSLQPFLEGERIIGIDVLYERIIKNINPQEFSRLLVDRVIKSIKRRGKYLLFNLSEGDTLVIHLRMTGQLLISKQEEPLTKHTHLVFHLAGGKQLRFVDVRKFGLIFLVRTGAWNQAGGLGELGPEPLAEDFTNEVLLGLLKNRRGMLKAFLLDQKRIAGIGNIYADEISFMAGLQPKRKIETLKKPEIEALYLAIRTKLQEGVEFRGTSISDYVDGKGEKGSFQERLQVYDRAGQPCFKCGTNLVKSIVAGRGTVSCPKCQR
jgi:formamidopyrimidine-DNA glycosylase